MPVRPERKKRGEAQDKRGQIESAATPTESLASVGVSARMHDSFENPLVTRYASPEMSRIWSAQNRHATWRHVWISIAEAQHELGLKISKTQIAAMKKVAAKIDFDAVAAYERKTRHDVMAHIHAFGDAAPEARGIIHLGATSMDIVDNADLILTRSAMDLLFGRLVAAAGVLAEFCDRHAELPTLGFTHLQAAQLTTVGKRASLWLQDIVADIENIESLRNGLKARGLRGATGTQASFLKLLGSSAKVEKMERLFAERLGFPECVPVCGQTYSRKVDVEISNTLASFAAGMHKICNDIRLLQMMKEIEEPFEKTQVGSSAMPYKRNPALSERATGLARFLISLASSPLMTLSAQMFERTLDDSSNKRITVPEAFLAADALAILLYHICDGLVVYPATIADRVQAELPFIATEEIMMEAVERGGDRQAIHERLRQHTHAVMNMWKNPDLMKRPPTGEMVILSGEEYNQRIGEASHSAGLTLISRLQADPMFEKLKWDRLLDPFRHTGLAAHQTRAFLNRHVKPKFQRWAQSAIEPPRLSV